MSMISGQKCSPEAELVAGKFGNPTLLTTVVSHIYAYDRAKTLSFILLIRRKSTEFEN